MSMWYAVISLGAIIMVGLIFKMARGGELRDLRERLIELEAAREEAETSRQQELRKEKHARRERDSAVKDMEQGLRSIYTLQNQLYEKEKLLKNRDAELTALQSQVSALTQQANEKGLAKKPVESALRKELTKKTSLLQAKENVIRELKDTSCIRASMATQTRQTPGGVPRSIAAWATAAREETGTTGKSTPQARPWTTPIPILRLVKLPGPRPKAIPSSWLRDNSASASNERTIGSINSA